MYEVSGELPVTTITIWWLQKLGKDWQKVNKQHRSLMGEGFNLSKLHELEVRKQYQIEITNRLVALGNLIVDEDTNGD